MATDDQPKRLAIVKEWYLLAGSTLGIVLGLLTLFDRFFAPSVRVLGVRPVYIRGTEESGLLKGNATRGIGFIVEVESGSREASLTSLEMSGRKYLTPNQWLANQADHVDITSAEVSRKVRRPFYSVWMSAWPEDGKSRIRLERRLV